MIHRYKNNGYNIVLDVNSGSVHVVDELVYDIIGLLDEGKAQEEICQTMEADYKREEISQALNEIQELKNQGMLFTEDIYRKAIDHFKERETVVKAL